MLGGIHTDTVLIFTVKYAIAVLMPELKKTRSPGVRTIIGDPIPHQKKTRALGLMGRSSTSLLGRHLGRTQITT